MSAYTGDRTSQRTRLVSKADCDEPNRYTPMDTFRMALGLSGPILSNALSNGVVLSFRQPLDFGLPGNRESGQFLYREFRFCFGVSVYHPEPSINLVPSLAILLFSRTGLHRYTSVGRVLPTKST